MLTYSGSVKFRSSDFDSFADWMRRLIKAFCVSFLPMLDGDLQRKS